MKTPRPDTFDTVYLSAEMYYGWELRREFTDFVEKSNLVGKTALDLGCGEGRYSVYLAERGCMVTAIDISRVGLNKLHNIAVQKELTVNVVQQDLAAYVFSENQYDIVVAATILDHLSDDVRKRVIEGIKICLRNGGITYVNVFTISDPGYQVKGADSNMSRTHGLSDTSVFVRHYFQPQELRQQFADLQIHYYYEGIEPDFSHGTPHFHGWASMIAQKRAQNQAEK